MKIIRKIKSWFSICERELYGYRCKGYECECARLTKGD